MSTTWTLKTGTADYISACGKFEAFYVRTVNGYACYYVFATGTPKKLRKASLALVVGGLPKFVNN